MFFAVLHIIGAIIVCFILFIILGFIVLQREKAFRKKLLREVSIIENVNLEGFDIDSLDNSPHYDVVILYLSKKYSTDLFVNGISDLLGIVLSVWEWGTVLISFGLFTLVCWVTFTNNLDSGVYVWLVILFLVISWLVGISFSYLCKTLTGRFPGQARRVRKFIYSKSKIRGHVTGP